MSILWYESTPRRLEIKEDDDLIIHQPRSPDG
jgi:hypothetical protein